LRGQLLDTITSNLPTGATTITQNPITSNLPTTTTQNPITITYLQKKKIQKIKIN